MTKHNTGYIHTQCAEQRHQQFQAQHPAIDLSNVSHVKLGISDDNTTEWMWVKLDEFDNDQQRAVGQLDNDPVQLTNCKCGDWIAFTYDEIAELYYS